MVAKMRLLVGANCIYFHIILSFHGLVGRASEVAIDAIVGAGLEGDEIDTQGSSQSPRRYGAIYMLEGVGGHCPYSLIIAVPQFGHCF
jgi:hypothetical protein